MILIAASILAARKLAPYDGGKGVPATMSAVADGVRWAEEIMKEIDKSLACGTTVNYPASCEPKTLRAF